MQRTKLWPALVLLLSAAGCDIQPTYSGPVAEAYQALGRGDDKGALRQLNKIIHNQPTADAYQLRATIRLTTADFRGAVVDATNGLKLDPKNEILKSIKEDAEFFEQNAQDVEGLGDE